MKPNRDRVERLADKTADAHSWDNYGPTRWAAAIAMLCRRGYSDREVEAIMRSKWTRWAADQASDRKGWKHGQTNSADLARFLDSFRPEELPRYVQALVDGTFSGQEATHV